MGIRIPSLLDRDSDVTQKKLILTNSVYLFFKLNIALFFVWFLGYFSFSTSWIILGVIVYLFYEYLKSNRERHQRLNISLAKNEKSEVTARLKDLPSWVFFPDVERAEWINKMLLQLWPFITNYVKEILLKTIQPKISESVPEYLKPFKFEKIDLGDIAPRLGGIKVYTGNNIRRDEIILDVEIYYFSDGLLRVEMKGVVAGIKDIEIRGTLRVTLKPLIPRVPLLGAITVCFLNNPVINFNLTDVGSILEIPGINDTIHGIVQDVVASLMVLPNRISVPLIEDVDLNKLRHPLPDGVLRIHVVSAKELIKADISLIGRSSSDPYCVLRVGGQKFQTKVVTSSISPQWDEYFEAIIDQKSGQFMELTVFDKDAGNKDDFLGSASVDINVVYKKGKLDTWLHLEEIKSGTVHVCLTWLNLCSQPEDFTEALLELEDETRVPTSPLYSGYLRVVLDSAQNLMVGRRIEEPSPYVTLQLNNRKETSTVKQRTPNPTWEEFFQFLVVSPDLDSLTVTVLDDKRNNTPIGYCKIKLKMLLTENQMTLDRSFRLTGASNPNSVIFLRLALRALVPGKDRQKVAQNDTHSSLSSSSSCRLDSTSSDIDPISSSDNVEGSDWWKKKPRSPIIPSIITTDLSTPEFNGDDLTTVTKSRANNKDTEVVLRKSVEAKRSSSMRVSSSTAGFDRPRIQLTVRYSQPKQKLILVVHKAQKLTSLDSDHLADVGVKISLFPKELMHNRRKTKYMKNTVDPVYDETFEFPLNQGDLVNCILRVEVRSRAKFLRSKQILGMAEVQMARFEHGKPSTEWFELISRAVSGSNLSGSTSQEEE